MDTGTNRAKRRIYSYGLEQEMFDNLLREQGEVCAICGNPQRLRLGKPQELHVDHDHVTGEVRGLLCTWCNTRLGWLEQYLYPILTYLMRSTRWGNDLHDWAMHEVETHDLQQPTDLYI